MASTHQEMTYEEAVYWAEQAREASKLRQKLKVIVPELIARSHGCLRDMLPTRTEPAPRLPPFSVEGMDSSMAFAPRGCISMPRERVKIDGRPIDWMFVSFDDMKPLVVVREELRLDILMRACSEEMKTELSVPRAGLSGRRLFAGEAPPF
ncbi:hypothetical protein PENSPDRAFT_281191 [Peniophora sp. CONT]|nr:hypothetical protein PENSPDRAFT_281191 [Peniophora sp. CONT]